MTAVLALLLGLSSLTALAQHEETRTGKKGEITFGSPVRIGNVSLSAASYQIQHVVEGFDHFIVFKRILSGSPYFTGVSGKESARVKCRIEPLSDKAKYTGLRFGVNSAGETTVEEVQIKGENVKHVF